MLTLDQLFRRYIMSETVQNVECEGCAIKQMKRLGSLIVNTDASQAVKPKTTFIKKLTIGKVSITP